MIVEWRVATMKAYTERGFYKLERSIWGDGWDLHFTQVLKGWPRCEPIEIVCRDERDCAMAWPTMESAIAAAEKHAASFEPQMKAG